MNEFDNNGSYERPQQQGSSDDRSAQSGYNDYRYQDYTRSTQSYAEYSYEPPKQKKHSRKAGNIVLALLCITALGVSSVVGYSLISDKSPLRHGQTASAPDKSDLEKLSDSVADSKEDKPERDINDLPTIETLAAPADAMSIPDIVKKLSPSVVGISCITDNAQVSGTGIIMSEDGYIVTNAHVVEGATAISVVVTDNTVEKEDKGDSSSKSVAEKILEKQNRSGDVDDSSNIEAELVGIDTQTDLAVLKIDSDGLTKAEFGTSSDIVVGELAIVIGNPLGFELANSVTSGIISATDRTITVEDRTMNMIQTDASINSGNSGGPLINAYGQVIGITSAKMSAEYVEGLGFAIPIDEAKIIVDDLIRYGYVKGRPTLGISGQTIGAFYAQYYGVPEGFIVRKVVSGSAGEKAGIEVNDIVVGIDGELISSIEEFNDIKSRHKAGDKISVSVYRNDNIVDLDVTLDEAKDDNSSQKNNRREEQDGYGGYDPYNGWGGYDDFYGYYTP